RRDDAGGQRVADEVEDFRQRRGVVGEFGEGGGSHGGGGHHHVDDGAHQNGADDADGHVSLGALGFLGGGGDGIEAEEGEEHDGGGGHQAAGFAAYFLREEAEGQEGVEVFRIERHQRQHH